jgi:hypothetical protein
LDCIQVADAQGSEALAVSHPHHLIRDAICFALVYVVWLADGELGLDYRRAQKRAHCAVTDGALQTLDR